MGISPTRAEARLTKTITAIKAIANLEKKIKDWLEDQDQRQVQVALLDNQISDLKTRIIPTAADAPPNAENAAFQATIDGLEGEKAALVALYGETSKLLNEEADSLNILKRDNPHAHPEAVAAQEAALARKNAAYPRLLIRHLYKCKRHGWADARMAKLTEHKARLRTERREMEAKLTGPTLTEQLAEALRQ